MANQRTLLMSAALPVSVILSVIFIAVLIQPVAAEISVTQKTIGTLRATQTEKQKLAHDIDTLIANYKAISPDTLTSLGEFVPDNADTAQLLASIGGMGANSNLFQQSAVFDLTANPTAENLKAGTPQVIKTNVVVKGTYDSLKQFLKASETNKRLMSIESINFNALGPGGQPLDTVSYFILLNSYFIQ